MSSYDLNTPVGRFVAERPELSRVFETFKIDYCCQGSRTLGQACTEQGIQGADVLAALLAAEAPSESGSEENWLETPLTQLVEHIVKTHHAYLKAELPRLTEMTTKVAEVHGEKRPNLVKVAEVFTALRSELEPHMMKEEMILFPAIRELEAASIALHFPFGTVNNPIRMMEHEHENAGQCLAELRRLTDDFTAPEDACNTYKAMISGLSDIEADTHKHIHKENNILFPRAAELESSRMATSS